MTTTFTVLLIVVKGKVCIVVIWICFSFNWCYTFNKLRKLVKQISINIIMDMVIIFRQLKDSIFLKFNMLRSCRFTNSQCPSYREADEHLNGEKYERKKRVVDTYLVTIKEILRIV